MGRARFDLVETDAGFHGRLVAGNGEPIWTTEVLSSEANVERAIASLRSAVDAGVRVRHVDERSGQPAVWTDQPDQA